jgi:putative IMPACT (imprinted ancient) family translation regulator
MTKKSQKQIPMLFDDEYHCNTKWIQYEKIISDRGSKYSVTGGQAKSRENIKEFLKKLKKNRKYASATHNSWAARISHEGAIFETKSDDGETGAGQVILYQLRKQKSIDIIVVVTRWYGGTKLYADRFKHLQDATIYWIKNSL